MFASRKTLLVGLAAVFAPCGGNAWSLTEGSSFLTCVELDWLMGLLFVAAGRIGEGGTADLMSGGTFLACTVVINCQFDIAQKNNAEFTNKRVSCTALT